MNETLKISITVIALFAIFSLPVFTAPANAQTSDLSVTFNSVPADSSKNNNSGAGSIVDIAVSDGRFTTLVAAVTAAGLAETLAGPGPFTVFAPTDDAFAKLPAGTIEALLNDTDTLTQILLYHVLSGEAKAKLVVERERLLTLQGGDVKIRVTKGGNVFINDSQVIITNIRANNGIIHVIDTVLLPQDATEISGTQIPVSLYVNNDGNRKAENFIVQVKDGDRLIHRERVNNLAANSSRLISFTYTPSSSGTSTLSASVDPFGLISENDETNNSAERSFDITRNRGANPVITDVNVFFAYSVGDTDYYGVQWRVYNAGTRPARNVNYSVYLTNRENKVDNGAVNVAMDRIKRIKPGGFMQGSAIVDASSLRAGSATFFFRGELPGKANAAAKKQSDAYVIEFSKKGLNKNMLDIVETAIDAGAFNTLAAALGAADLVNALRGNGQFTVFAPTDTAFAKLPAGTVDSLLGDVPTLSNILLYHVSNGIFYSGNVVSRNSLHMANNVEAPISISGGSAFIDNARIVTVDIFTRNGIIHIIDEVIIP